MYALQRTAVRYCPETGGPKALWQCGKKAAWDTDPETDRKIRRTQVYVQVHPETGRSSYGNILRCGSVWACPVCATKISLERSTELRGVLEAHVRAGVLSAQRWASSQSEFIDEEGRPLGLPAGGGGWFCTLTIRHERRQRLKPLRQAVSRTWRQILQLRGWKRWRETLGYIGYVRALEVTVGENAGWHPHLHCLLFFDRQPTESQRADFEEWLFAAWADRIAAALGESSRPERWTAVDVDGGPAPGAKALGVDVQEVREDSESLSNYLLKMGVAFEAASWTRKEGRHGNRTMFQVLAEIQAAPHAAEIRLWREWTRDMLGARQLTWSRGLRAHFELGAELEDEELVYADDGSEVVCTIDRDTFEAYGWRMDFRVRVLEIAEWFGADDVYEFIGWCIDEWPNPRERPPPAWYLMETEGLR